jgi:hypothetical protein
MANLVMKFRGGEYVIPENRAFEVGGDVEEIATLFEIIGWMKSPRFHKMARCLGVMLRAAGCPADDREVYAELMASVTSGGANDYLQSALFGLVSLMMDGAPQGKGDASAEKQAAS